MILQSSRTDLNSWITSQWPSLHVPSCFCWIIQWNRVHAIFTWCLFNRNLKWHVDNAWLTYSLSWQSYSSHFWTNF